MSTKDLVMVIDKRARIEVKLFKNLLEVDLKKGLKKELEDVLEANSALRKSLGFLFQSVIPLDVPLKDIESVELDERKHVKIIIPHRRDIMIPLGGEKAKEFVNKLKELIQIEKQKEIDRLMASLEARKGLIRDKMDSKIGKARILGKERE